MDQAMSNAIVIFGTTIAAQIQAMGREERQQFYGDLNTFLERVATAKRSGLATGANITLNNEDKNPEDPGREAGTEKGAVGESLADVGVGAGVGNKGATGNIAAAGAAQNVHRPRGRRATDAHLGDLMRRDKIAPGYYLWIPNLSIPGDRAKLEYRRSEGKQKRVSVWRVTCATLNLNRAIIRGTGPAQLVEKLKNLGIKAPPPTQWGKKLLVYSLHPVRGELAIGTITGLKTELFNSRMGL